MNKEGEGEEKLHKPFPRDLPWSASAQYLEEDTDVPMGPECACSLKGSSEADTLQAAVLSR